MNYLVWSLLALLAYTFVPPLTKLATDGLSSHVVALITNGMLVLAALVIVIVRGETGQFATAVRTPAVLGAGVALSVGIIAYYRALKLGDVSVVTPVFGMFLVTASVIGFLFLDEPFSLQKVVGILLAIVAIILVTTDDEVLSALIPR